MVRARLYREAIRDLAICGLSNEAIMRFVPFNNNGVSSAISAWRRMGFDIPKDAERRARYYAG